MTRQTLTKTHKSGVKLYYPEYQSPTPRTEDAEQIEFIAWVKFRFPNALIWHTVNEVRSRSVEYHEKQRRKGKLKGVSDITILYAGVFIAIEMKRANISKSHKFTDEQAGFIQGVINNGGKGACCYGSEAAKTFLLECLT